MYEQITVRRRVVLATIGEKILLGTTLVDLTYLLGIITNWKNKRQKKPSSSAMFETQI